LVKQRSRKTSLYETMRIMKKLYAQFFDKQ